MSFQFQIYILHLKIIFIYLQLLDDKLILQRQLDEIRNIIIGFDLLEINDEKKLLLDKVNYFTYKSDFKHINNSLSDSM